MVMGRPRGGPEAQGRRQDDHDLLEAGALLWHCDGRVSGRAVCLSAQDLRLWRHRHAARARSEAGAVHEDCCGGEGEWVRVSNCERD